MAKGIRVRSLNELGKGQWKLTPDSIVVLKKPPSDLSKQLKSFETTPHDLLWAAVDSKWPGLAVREFEGAVPDRKYRIDIAIPSPTMIAIEVDGYQHHGKYLADFKRDRIRQNMFSIYGWTILRFTAGEIRNEIEGCLQIIQMAIDARNIRLNIVQD